ncbi:MAG: Fic family protein, partial [Bdellovibrionales bacterium]|nr:Fic family protein [Bdellovibrionales bacterium]
GSYQIMALDNIYFTESASHHPLFDPTLPSSLPNLPAYIERKWGGLKNIAQAERVVFSKLGTFETLFSLSNQGFSSFFQVNSPYGMRGSKTLLAFQPDRADPLVVFYSFIGEDLFHHKLMQLAIDFGESFRKVRILTSHGLKSWDQAQAVVAEAIANLPSIPIDDLVLGYGEIANQFLNNSQYVKLIQAGSMGEFAEVSYFTVVGKNGLQRNVLVISKIAYRYFGKSVLPLIQPFLEKGVDRVIFAGSAGVLDDKIPQHSLIVPRTFSLLSDSDEVTRHFELYNDFYDLAPYGEVYSGAHISVASPLIESQPRIRKMRDEFKIMSVDVEGAQIAALIQHHNRQTSASKPPVRFASAYIATDVPHTGEKSQPTFGLHDPNFIGKSQAKLRYISLLKLLWDIPSKLKHSAHASLIAKFFGEQIEGLNLSSNTIEDYRNLWREIYLRHKESFQLSMEGGRVSQGLVRVYGDLLSWLERKAPTAFRDNEELEFSVGKSNGEPNESAKKNTSVSDDVARTIILLSLLRSSTLNSGDVVYNRGKISSDIVQKNAEKGALEAVDWIFAHRNEDLEVSDILELHSVLTKDVLPLTYRGKIVEFSYLDSFGNTIQSNELILEFLVWFRQVTPSYETAIECFHRYEAIHPHKDGNGRMAELLAQSLLVRGKLAPLLFPNRFDIDYILSLRRNGGTSALNVSFVEGLVRDTNMFIAQLLKSYGEFGSDNLKFEYDSQDLIVTAGFDRSIRIQTYYLSDHSFKLERESREFIDEGFAEVKKPGVEITRRQYRVIYAFMPEAKFEMTHDSVLGGPSCRENIVKGEN